MPKVSVIMGIYNCADTLSEAIESIINQTFKDWEVIMCDDGSLDRTLEIDRCMHKNMIILRCIETKKIWG